MKHRISAAALITGSSLLTAASAHAHPGDHGEHIMTMVLHWLSSPSHSLFAVIGGVALSALIVKTLRKKNS